MGGGGVEGGGGSGYCFLRGILHCKLNYWSILGKSGYGVLEVPSETWP